MGRRLTIRLSRSIRGSRLQFPEARSIERWPYISVSPML
jgi:hypothetical protein